MITIFITVLNATFYRVFLQRSRTVRPAGWNHLRCLRKTRFILSYVAFVVCCLCRCSICDDLERQIMKEKNAVLRDLLDQKKMLHIALQVTYDGLMKYLF